MPGSNPRVLSRRPADNKKITLIFRRQSSVALFRETVQKNEEKGVNVFRNPV